MKNKMTTKDLKNYIISEAKKLHKIEVLKEEKKRIDKELKMLSENESEEYYEASNEIESMTQILDKFGFSLVKNTPEVLEYEKPIKGFSVDLKLVFYYNIKQNIIALIKRSGGGINGVDYIKSSNQLNDILIKKLSQGPKEKEVPFDWDKFGLEK